MKGNLEKTHVYFWLITEMARTLRFLLRFFFVISVSPKIAAAISVFYFMSAEKKTYLQIEKKSFHRPETTHPRLVIYHPMASLRSRLGITLTSWNLQTNHFFFCVCSKKKTPSLPRKKVFCLVNSLKTISSKKKALPSPSWNAGKIRQHLFFCMNGRGSQKVLLQAVLSQTEKKNITLFERGRLGLGKKKRTLSSSWKKLFCKNDFFNASVSHFEKIFQKKFLRSIRRFGFHSWTPQSKK